MGFKYIERFSNLNNLPSSLKCRLVLFPTLHSSPSGSLTKMAWSVFRPLNADFKDRIIPEKKTDIRKSQNMMQYSSPFLSLLSPCVRSSSTKSVRTAGSVQCGFPGLYRVKFLNSLSFFSKISATVSISTAVLQRMLTMPSSLSSSNKSARSCTFFPKK